MIWFGVQYNFKRLLLPFFKPKLKANILCTQMLANCDSINILKSLTATNLSRNDLWIIHQVLHISFTYYCFSHNKQYSYCASQIVWEAV